MKIFWYKDIKLLSYLHMSGKGNSSKGHKNKRKKADKRKASGSPNTNYTQCSQAATKTPCLQVNTQADDKLFNNSVDFVSAVMNRSTSPVMNFSSAMPFALQPQTPSVLQTPTMYQPTFGTQQSTPVQANAPPIWATGLIEDVRSLKAVIPKIDKIEDSVNNIKSKMTTIKTRVSSLETKFTEIEASCNFISKEYDSQKAELHQAKEHIKSLETDCRKLEASVRRSRSMRENLIFYGLQETNEENCEML